MHTLLLQPCSKKKKRESQTYGSNWSVCCAATACWMILSSARVSGLHSPSFMPSTERPAKWVRCSDTTVSPTASAMRRIWRFFPSVMEIRRYFDIGTCTGTCTGTGRPPPCGTRAAALGVDPVPVPVPVPVPGPTSAGKEVAAFIRSTRHGRVVTE
jgi:hypothetical protein